MLTRIFPLADLEPKELWRVSRLFLLGSEQELLTSLALQAAITAASAKEYVALLGCHAVNTASKVRGMPQFQDSMVDFIRPKYLNTAEALGDYLVRFHGMAVYPDLIVLLDFQDYARQVSGTASGDRAIVRLLAFLEDVVDFAAKETSLRSCRLLVTYAGTDGRPGTSLHRWGSLHAARWWCRRLEDGGRFILKSYGPTCINFKREGSQLCFTGLSEQSG